MDIGLAYGIGRGVGNFLCFRMEFEGGLDTLSLEDGTAICGFV